MEIQAGEFKAKCLQLMDHVQKFHEEIVITKYGKPVAKMVPVEAVAQVSPFGFLQNSVKIKGDIISPLDISWEANE